MRRTDGLSDQTTVRGRSGKGREKGRCPRSGSASRGHCKGHGFCGAFTFSVLGLTWSPIKGPEGNIEYLIFIQKEEQPEAYESEQAAEAALEETQAAKGGISETEENRQLIASIVEKAHETLKE